MEIKIEGIHPSLNSIDDGLVGNHPGLRDPVLQKPVEKSEKSNQQESKKNGGESNPGAGEGKEKVDVDKLKQMVEETKPLFDHLPTPVDLNIQVNDKTGEIVVQIFNQQTDELIRQIPPEEMVKIRERMAEFRGVLCDEKV